MAQTIQKWPANWPKQGKYMEKFRQLAIFLILIGFFGLAIIDLSAGEWPKGLASAMLGLANTLLFLL